MECSKISHLGTRCIEDDSHLGPHKDCNGASWFYGVEVGQEDKEEGSLQLRDKFAMCALHGELASQGENAWHESFFGILADRCYQLADAMLKAREGKR